MGGDLQKGHFPNISASDTYSVTGEDFPAAAKAIMEQAGPRHLRLPLKADDGYETTVWSNKQELAGVLHEANCADLGGEPCV